MGRLLDRLVALNDGWAKPFGEFNHRWVSALFRPIRPVRDLLNGTWLGHPLHPAITDDVYSVLSVRNSVRSRTSFGGTAPAEVRRQIRYWRKRLKQGARPGKVR